MDHKYYEYLGDPSFYAPNSELDTAFRISIPAGWCAVTSDHWLTLAPVNQQLPQQGWKIHISARADDAAECVETVAAELFRREVSFKFVRQERAYLWANAKYAPRTSSGKLITVYPASTEEFLTLLSDLEYLTRDLRPGPYVLTDRRWRESNVYYRYGGFARIEFERDGEMVLGLENDKGELVEDVRTPSYQIPEWVTPPAVLLDEEKRQEFTHPTKLAAYAFTEALHFSNGGGVYLAKERDSSRTVVIKEGRPHAGIDGHLIDGYTRVGNEALTLQRLGDSPYTPNWIDDFTAWEHRFLVMDHVAGVSFGRFIAENYPFPRSVEPGPYLENLSGVVAAAIAGIRDVHGRGIALGDVQPNNILIRDQSESQRVSFIDFEAAGPMHSPGTFALATPGFIDRFDDPLGHRDWIGLLRIVRFALLPQGTIEALDPNKLREMRTWIGKNMGNEADDLLQAIIDAAQEEGFDLLPDERRSPAQHVGGDGDPRGSSSSSADLKRDLGRFVIANSDPGSRRLAPGDIRQWIRPGGDLSIAYGGAGVAMVLHRSGISHDIPRKWAAERSEAELAKAPAGLFNGRAGIATVLAEVGYHEKARILFDGLASSPDEVTGLNLDSGLSGVGLSLLGAAVHFDDHSYLEAAKDYADRIVEQGAEDERLLGLEETDVTPTGLLYGWAGPAFFLGILARVSGSSAYEQAANRFLQQELDRLETYVDTLLTHAPDGRLMAYLSLGSAGLVLPLSQLRDDSSGRDWNQELSGIGRACTSRPCAHFGLFRGFAGLLWTANRVDVEQGLVGEDSLGAVVSQELDLYLLDDKHGRATPGDFMHRRSCDLASGASGLICALNDAGTQQASWLPVLALDELTAKLSLNEIHAARQRRDSPDDEGLAITH